MTEWKSIEQQLDDAISREQEVSTPEAEAAFIYGLTQSVIGRIASNVDNADWRYWLKRPEWTPEQAICLLYNINPLEYEKIKNNQQIEMLRLNAADKGNMTPYEWQQFGIEQMLPFPRQIRDIKKPVVELQTEAVGDGGAGSQDGKEPTGTKIIRANSNEIEFSGLLNIPGKVDDWFEDIDVMTNAFYLEYGVMPTKAQAWAQLWTNPPEGYAITTGKDRGDDCLHMPGAKSLSKCSATITLSGSTTTILTG